MWQIATAALLRHLPDMNLPVLLADVSSVGLDTVIPAGAVLVVGGSLLAWARSQTTTENRVEVLRQDNHALDAEFKAYREMAQKRHDDLVHRIAQIEGREGRVDERMRALGDGLTDVRKGQEQLLSMVGELLSIERSNARRRREDAA